MSKSDGLVSVTGGCHCRAVRFEALTPRKPDMLQCNCSICSANGYLHLFIKHENFTLLSGEDHLTSYRFGSGQANHLFCKTCGVKSFYQPRSHPGSWSVHLACVDSPHHLEPNIIPFDGENWEKSAKAKGLG